MNVKMADLSMLPLVFSSLLCVSFLIHSATSVQDLNDSCCLQTNSMDGLPPFVGSAAGPLFRIQHRHQAIIPTYAFNCCGVILEWGVDLNPVEENIMFNFDFQVWRPTPTYSTQSGCYSLVDNMYVTSISIQENITSDHVARVTPLPQERVKFEVGDILGFYVESEGVGARIEDDGVALDSSGDHTREIVWYASVASHTPEIGSCPYPVGATRVLDSLTRAAPIISVSVSTFSCSHLESFYPSPTPTVIPNDSREPSNGAFMTLVIVIPIVSAVAMVILLLFVVIIALGCKIRRLKHTLVEREGPAENSYHRTTHRGPRETADSQRHSYDYPPHIPLTDNEAYGVVQHS